MFEVTTGYLLQVLVVSPAVELYRLTVATSPPVKSPVTTKPVQWHLLWTPLRWTTRGRSTNILISSWMRLSLTAVGISSSQQRNSFWKVHGDQPPVHGLCVWFQFISKAIWIDLAFCSCADRLEAAQSWPWQCNVVAICGHWDSSSLALQSTSVQRFFVRIIHYFIHTHTYIYIYYIRIYSIYSKLITFAYMHRCFPLNYTVTVP